MAMKAMLLMLACLLLVTGRVSSTEEHHHDYKAHAPAAGKHHEHHHEHHHDHDHEHHHPHHVHHHHAEAPKPPKAHGCSGKCRKYYEDLKDCCGKFKCVPLRENLCPANSWDHFNVMYRD